MARRPHRGEHLNEVVAMAYATIEQCVVEFPSVNLFDFSKKNHVLKKDPYLEEELQTKHRTREPSYLSPAVRKNGEEF